MEKTVSADGTTIAYDAEGEGPLVVLVGGAFCDRRTFADLSTALVGEGFRAVSYDRRGRGDSGDTAPYAAEREIEDLDAVIAAESGGGPVHLFGMSSGGALVLQGLAAGSRIDRAAVFEPPYRIDGAPPPPEDYIGTLSRLAAADDRAGMVEYFQTRAVGLPAEALEPMKAGPWWNALLALAPTLIYDGLVMGGDENPVPTGMLARIDVPVLAVTSTGTALPWLSGTAQAVADVVPDGRVVRLEGGFHSATPDVLAPVLAAFYRAG
jgi:pimeloyl-ACP methyl ester carboxylesterase